MSDPISKDYFPCKRAIYYFDREIFTMCLQNKDVCQSSPYRLVSALIDNFHDIFRRAVQDYLLPGLNVHSSPCIQLENCTASGKELVDAALAKKGARLGLGPYKFNCHDANLKFLDFWEKKHCLLPLLSHIPSALCNTFDTQAVLTCHSVISAVIRWNFCNLPHNIDWRWVLY